MPTFGISKLGRVDVTGILILLLMSRTTQCQCYDDVCYPINAEAITGEAAAEFLHVSWHNKVSPPRCVSLVAAQNQMMLRQIRSRLAVGMWYRGTVCF